VGFADRRLKVVLSSHTYFSFGAGTSSPTTLVQRAAALGYQYLAITDHLNITSGVELFTSAKSHAIGALIGATIPVRVDNEAYPMVVLATSRRGYATVNELITHAHSRDEKDVPLPVFLTHTTDVIVLSGPREGLPSRLLAQRKLEKLEAILQQLRGAFRDRFYLQIFHDQYQWDHRRARVLRRLGQRTGIPIAAAPEIRYAHPDDYRLYDALVCGRLGITVDQPHPSRPQNTSQHLASPDSVAERIPFPEAIENANRIAREAAFDLLPDRLVPPAPHVPDGLTADAYIDERCREALVRLYAGRDLASARLKLDEELETIHALGLAGFFLVAAEVTDYCRLHGILAAGRGSAASSICCYLLGVTKTDPVAHNLLFERFLHTGKTTMPDIDIDISSSRRDEVLEWVEDRFGLTTEAMVCNKITYKLPLAIQDLGRSLGIPPETRNEITKKLGRDFRGLRPKRAAEAASVFNEVLGDAPVKNVLLSLLGAVETGHTRHIAPHAGGVVLSRDPLTHYSAMQKSSGGIRLIQLDKDDAEALGLIKLDLLGLRMLSALERAREEAYRLEGVWLDLGNLPDDARVWDAIGVGDTMGLFQIESPSQVTTSRVMKARNLKDLAHQIALIRPGPIQSGSVHPYMRRHSGKEEVTFWHPSLEPILAKTYGVLLFQEDVLRVAVHFAGFSWIEADRFRKKVSGFRELSDIEPDRLRFISGAAQTVGASPEQAETVFDAIKQFQGYGFAESHAYAFAIHAYASAWLRIHYPAEYMAAIMTEAPGMWSRNTKRQEARAWDVPFLPFDINASGLHYRVERSRGKKRVRPPLTAIDGVAARYAEAILRERLLGGSFTSTEDFFERISSDREQLEALAKAGALDSDTGMDRRALLFRVGVLANSGPSGRARILDPTPSSPPLDPLRRDETFYWDFATTHFSTMEVHALDLVRDQLRELGATPLKRFRKMGVGAAALTAGLVVARQRPGTAKGFAFFVIEDGPMRAELVISPKMWDANRELLRDAAILVSWASLSDPGHQPTLRAHNISLLPFPITVSGYHYR
jgi:error-prone DNA polymerase